MSLRTTLQKWRTRANAYFVANWRVVPFQPILFLFVFLGAVLALIFDVNHPAFGVDLAFSLWVALSILCPPMAVVAWWLIRYETGKQRYFGFWIRAGADVGQLASVSCFLAIISSGIDPIASEIYAAELFAAIWWFLVVLVVRDVWKLVLTERIATAIRDEEDRSDDS